jgi:GNAT superfamily N-acetyltransferase
MGITVDSTAELLRTSHRGWLSEENGVITGFAIGDGTTGEVWVVAVHPEFEGRGGGSALLQLTEDWLWSLGWTELWLSTSSDTTKRAFPFYTKRGWSPAKVTDTTLVMIKNKPV